MTIFEKIKHQSLNEVRLYKEGAFWVAYEQSAYFFAKTKGYRPTKKFVKCIQQLVVSVGFPNTNFSKVQNFGKVIKDEENFKMFHLEKEIVKEEFEKWKEEIPRQNLPIVIGIADLGINRIKAETQSCKSSNPEIPITIGRFDSILDKISRFDLSNSTPMECMNFLHKLKIEN